MALNRPEPASIGDLASLLALDRTSLTANLKPLERRGLICRPVEGDRRRRRLKLTEEGRRTLRAAAPLWRRAQAEMEAVVGNADADKLRSILRALSL